MTGVQTCALPIFILHRDFDGQELRVFAHFESGALWRMYNDNPDLDPHAYVGKLLAPMLGREYSEKDRWLVKILNFLALYGGGKVAASKKIGCTLPEAQRYKELHDLALPGRKLLNQEIRRIVNSGEPIVTWGGRKYYPEEPRLIKGQIRSFEYKLINYLIQGSAADITKEVMCQWYYSGERTSRFLLAVYDELNVSSAFERRRDEMELLRQIMENVGISIPMRSSGKIGKSWGDLEKYDDAPF